MRILAFTLLVVVLCAQQSAAQCTWSQSSTTVSTPCLVGIGTTAPDARTTIQGGTGQQLTFKDPNGTTRFTVQAQHGPSDFFYDLNSGNYDFRLTTYNYSGSGGSLSFWTGNNTNVPSERVRIAPSGNVGIGTTNPDARTTIQGGTGRQLTFKDSSGTTRFIVQAQHGPSDFFYDLNSGNYDFRLTTYNYSGSGGSLSFWTGNNTLVPSERVRIAPNGNVGIGTNAPQALLHVAGDIRVDGNIAARYQDVAEWVPAREPLAAGTVVVLDPSTVNQVTSSSAPYSTTVAGVVSDQPGLILGEAGESKVKVATTGRVRVKVDATKRPIAIGDLLVSSGEPGVAMASEAVDVGGVKFHRPGTLIGKALQPLSGGRGEILVLLALQ
jgi:hypothetical protein